MARKLTTEDFIAKAREIHGNKYDYSKAVYTRGHDKVTIICPLHGEFQQSPSNHTHSKNKRGCPACGGSKPHTKETFILEANAQHLNKYNYDKVEYKNNKSEVVITCPVHGDFTQIAGMHLRGHGCPECGDCKKHDTNSFIAKAKEIHGDKYDYSKSIYTGSHDPITVICPNHGEFQTIPTNHFAGKGCFQCAESGFDPSKPAVLYYLKVLDGRAYKIGITNRSTKERFRDDSKNIEVLKEWYYELGSDAFKEEQKLLKEFKDAKYRGIDLLKDGNTELFSYDVLGLDT